MSVKTAANQEGQSDGGIVERSAITRDDLLGRDRPLRVLLRWARPTTASGLGTLLLLIVIPLSVMSTVTIIEDRFMFGHVVWDSEDLDGVVIDLNAVVGSETAADAEGESPDAGTITLEKPSVRGMSFMGDTMVWPYAILLPILLALLNVAILRFERFFGSVKRVLSARWLNENPEDYLAIVEKTRRILAGRGYWRIFKWIAIAAGFAFFAWNTITCTRADIFKPYKTDAPFVEIDQTYVQIDREAVISAPRPIDEVFPVQVPKWDCDINEGPLSWLSARLWVLLIGYVWIPYILFKLFNLVAATYVYTNALSKHEGALDIKPLSPDEAGGLSRLASLAIALTYPIVVVGLMMAMPFFKENTNVSPHNLVLFIPFVPVFFAVFFMPLLGVHWAMVAAKDRYLEDFAELFDVVHEKFIREVRSPTLEADEFTRLEISMRGLTESYEKIAKMPVWPFEISTVYRLVTAVLIPVMVPLLLDMIIGSLLSGAK